MPLACKRKPTVVLTLIYRGELRSMAGVRQHGWRAIPAVSSGYEADTLPERFRSVGRYRFVHAQCTVLSAVIAAKGHGYQINLDIDGKYSNRQGIA